MGRLLIGQDRAWEDRTREFILMKAYQDIEHEGNSAKYYTGEYCITKGCFRPAGTFWSKHWCFEHNVVRMDRITNALVDIRDAPGE